MKLKNYFQMGIGAGLVLALVAGVVWYKSDSAEVLPVAAEEGVDPLESGPDMRLEEDIAAKNAAAMEPSGDVVPQDREKVDLGRASQSFAQGLKQLSVCLNLNTESGDQVEPTSENLLKALKTNLRDPIMTSVDTIVWSLRADGEERRIRIETDYSDSQTSSRNLRYFKIDSQGVPSLLPLPAEQTKNPSEAFVASLQKDGVVYQEEKSLRSYFENGQEMTVTEKDGNINDFAITSGPKTFRCAGILTTSSSCKCE